MEKEWLLADIDRVFKRVQEDKFSREVKNNPILKPIRKKYDPQEN